MAQSSLSVLFFLNEDKTCMLRVPYCNGQIEALKYTFINKSHRRKLLSQLRGERERKRKEKERENIIMSRYIYCTLHSTGTSPTFHYPKTR